MFISEDDLIDTRNALEWALDLIPDECNCHPEYESDTNALVHEDDCQIFIRDHIDIMCTRLEDQLVAQHRVQWMGLRAFISSVFRAIAHH